MAPTTFPTRQPTYEPTHYFIDDPCCYDFDNELAGYLNLNTTCYEYVTDLYDVLDGAASRNDICYTELAIANTTYRGDSVYRELVPQSMDVPKEKFGMEKLWFNIIMSQHYGRTPCILLQSAR